MRLPAQDWVDITDLRRRVAMHGALLADATRLLRDFEQGGVAGLRTHQDFGETLEATTDWTLQAVFRTLQDIQALLLACNPRDILALRHGPGPDLGEEAALAEAFARALVPGVPDAVWLHFNGRYMFYNR